MIKLNIFKESSFKIHVLHNNEVMYDKCITVDCILQGMGGKSPYDYQNPFSSVIHDHRHYHWKNFVYCL